MSSQGNDLSLVAKERRAVSLSVQERWEKAGRRKNFRGDIVSPWLNHGRAGNDSNYCTQRPAQLGPAHVSDRLGSARTLRPTGTLERGDKERGAANFIQEKQEMWQFPSRKTVWGRQAGWLALEGILWNTGRRKEGKKRDSQSREWIQRNILEAGGVKELKDQSECTSQLPSSRSVRTERWPITALIPSWKYFSPSARVRHFTLCISVYFCPILSAEEFQGRTVFRGYGKSNSLEFYYREPQKHHSAQVFFHSQLLLCDFLPTVTGPFLDLYSNILDFCLGFSTEQGLEPL